AARPLDALLDDIGPGRIHRPQGTAVYLTASTDKAPRSLLNNLKHNGVLHEHVVLLTVEVPDVPYVPADARGQIVPLGKGLYRIVLRYGFMQQPDVPRDFAVLAEKGLPIDPAQTSYFIGRNSYVEGSPSVLPGWQRRLFVTLSRFASSAADFFRLPANRVVELGSRIEI
ncbi:MAG: KUP/HAK/KT family potassium transporter, partial [Reyranella sp.]|nr:KUP/HAK/KT family potassium transporter [Reyranella sp.]